jgi:hypothetical protein
VLVAEDLLSRRRAKPTKPGIVRTKRLMTEGSLLLNTSRDPGASCAVETRAGRQT